MAQLYISAEFQRKNDAPLLLLMCFILDKGCSTCSEIRYIVVAWGGGVGCKQKREATGK